MTWPTLPMPKRRNCGPCGVEWAGDDLPNCWLCDQPGEPGADNTVPLVDHAAYRCKPSDTESRKYL